MMLCEGVFNPANGGCVVREDGVRFLSGRHLVERYNLQEGDNVSGTGARVGDDYYVETIRSVNLVSVDQNQRPLRRNGNVFDPSQWVNLSTSRSAMGGISLTSHFDAMVSREAITEEPIAESTEEDTGDVSPNDFIDEIDEDEEW